jgi:hypothetical protein
MLVGNTYVTLCPICYELTFGFSTDPQEKTSGVKYFMSPDRTYNIQNKRE